MTLWDEIVEASPPAELDEVKQILGSELIDSNQALKNELQALTDMFVSLRLQTESLNQQHVLVQTTERSLGTLSGTQSMSKPASSLSGESSMQSSMSSTDIAHNSALTRVRSSFVHTQQAEMQAVKDHLHGALAAEHQALLSDIEHMQACLAEEADINAHAELAPPPLAALRAYGVRLQAQLQEADGKVQEEAQQRHEQKLGCLRHGIPRGQTTQSLDSLAASVSTQAPGRAPVKGAKRPDTAYEGGGVSADAVPKTAASSSNSHSVSDDDYRTTSPDVSLGTLQEVDGVTRQFDAILQAGQVFGTAQSSSRMSDRVSAGPDPPKKAIGKVKPSPRPRQARKSFMIAL